MYGCYDKWENNAPFSRILEFLPGQCVYDIKCDPIEQSSIRKFRVIFAESKSVFMQKVIKRKLNNWGGFKGAQISSILSENVPGPSKKSSRLDFGVEHMYKSIERI